MTLIEDREQWVPLAAAARQGDVAVWPAIIDRFEDLAVAFAVGLCGDLDEAPDIAQEAFVLAFGHIADLHDPSAFPAWLLRLVRTAANRRTRRRRLSMANPPPCTSPCTGNDTISSAGCSRPAADPEAVDANGRTPADWAAIKATRRPETDDSDILWTRIRAIDLFAPLRRGALVHIPPAYGLGAMRALFGMVDAFAPAHWRMIGFEHGPYEQKEFERETKDSATPATIALIGPGRPADCRRQFASTLDDLANTPGHKVVTCVPAPGHEHDITVALPGLAADPLVLATFVVATYSPEPLTVPVPLPEGFDARITFDRARARARIWPAIDPGRTSTRAYPDPRHEHIANAARSALLNYALLDPAFELANPNTFDDPTMPSRHKRSCAT